MEMTGKFRTRWIGRALPGLTFQSEVMPAPCLRREFDCPKHFSQATVRVSAPGYFDLRLNGFRIDTAELVPTVTVFDRRVRFIRFDVSGLLEPGRRDTWSAVLGNGWYNCHTHEVWHFDKAAWRDYPKFWFELEIDGVVVLASDRDWRVSTGGLLFDSLRNGEIYDARREPANWRLSGFDDSNWERPEIVAPPGGIPVEQHAPPCRVGRRIAPVTLERTGASVTADFGENLTGWCRIAVRAAAGTVFTIRYYERLAEPDHAVRLAQYTLSGDFQTDRYTACGAPAIEEWQPRFTYHGFRYAVVECSDPAAELCAIEAHFVHSDFARTGDYQCSNATFMKLKECAVRSFLGNFTGIPTDCPQREKNGWTGDALLAASTGLYLFDTAESYIEWLETLCDSQRPDGQLAAIAPTGGWGFNGCSGPAWDSVIVLLPWLLYLHSGDPAILAKFYPNMLRYLDYCRLREEEDGLLDFGLGDWCAPNCICGNVNRCFTSSAYYVHDLDTVGHIARLLGHADDAAALEQRTADLRCAFRTRFHPAPADWGGNTMTELGMALEMDLTTPEERSLTAARLAATAQTLECRAEFGILGAKYAPRALARAGYCELALRFFTQCEYPGWANWLKMGATTLLENWEGSQSWNHIMFGDFAAFAFEYLGGIRLTPEFAAGGALLVEPCFPESLDSFQAHCETGRGRAECRWKRHGQQLEMEVFLPPGVKADIRLPDCHVIQEHSFARYLI